MRSNISSWWSLYITHHHRIWLCVVSRWHIHWPPDGGWRQHCQHDIWLGDLSVTDCHLCCLCNTFCTPMIWVWRTRSCRAASNGPLKPVDVMSEEYARSQPEMSISWLRRSNLNGRATTSHVNGIRRWFCFCLQSRLVLLIQLLLLQLHFLLLISTMPPPKRKFFNSHFSFLSYPSPSQWLGEMCMSWVVSVL